MRALNCVLKLFLPRETIIVVECVIRSLARGTVTCFVQESFSGRPVDKGKSMRTARLQEELQAIFTSKVNELTAVRGLHALVTIAPRVVTEEGNSALSDVMKAISKN